MKNTEENDFENWFRVMHPQVYDYYRAEYERDNVQAEDIPFDDFWNAYGKKTGKEKCKAKWKRMSKTERAEAMQVVPDYVEATPERQYRLNPLTFLNGKYYKDEELIQAARERLRKKPDNQARANKEAWDRILNG